MTQSTDVLDALIVGGGPAGTAAAFRAHELGLKTMVIDFDDVLKRIRDYPADKLILPDFGGGDRMKFPAGGDCITALQFGPIDKDEMCQSWKQLYTTFGIPVRTSVELTGVERKGDIWSVITWDHRAAQQEIFRAKHVVIALGRGVPRRFDIPGNTDGVAYRLDDPARYVSGPVLVVGGGTSAAEAVLAISRAKIDADDACSVYWAYRGTKMPRVSKALAEQFFEAYIGNGNIRHYPESEPVAVVTAPDKVEMVSLRVDRKTPTGRPSETVHLEFAKTRCIACIGEDIPEALLQTLGISMVPVGGKDKKMMAVTPLLETQQPNMYMIGDLLSQSYLETDDFAASADTFRQIKHRGNIKSALRDGVFVAEVIRQRVDGRANVDVVIRDADPAEGADRDSRVTTVLGLAGDAEDTTAKSPTPDIVDATPGYLVLFTPTGVEAEEFRLDTDGVTTLGRVNCDISFGQDTLLSDSHASITFRNGEYFLRDDGSRSGTYLRVLPDRPVRLRDGDLLRAGRQILVVSHNVRGMPPQIEHYDPNGQHSGSYPVTDTVVFGRSGGRSNPDVLLDETDGTLSRFHLAVSFENGEIAAQDFGSRNGTYLKVEAERQLAHGDRIRIGAQHLEIRMFEELPEKTGSMPAPAAQPESAAAAGTAAGGTEALAIPVGEVPAGVSAAVAETTAPPAPAEAPPPAPAAPSAPAAAAASAATGAHITFADQNIAGEIDPTQSLLEWADEKEVSLDYECWIGMCGCDAIRVVSGAEHLNDVTEKEIKTLKRKGLEPGPCRLACMTKASGPVVVEVIE